MSAFETSARPMVRFDGEYFHFPLEVEGVSVQCAVTYTALVEGSARSGVRFRRAQDAFQSLEEKILDVATEKFRAGAKRPLVIAADFR
ncbi:MAG TPA: DUF1488 family protein [Fimbriimonas sp.]|jgi:hypothetical protein|nr:DUF1488 family protein [Fimbriimonas sp.]